jgi:hypothetical protein
MYRQSLSSVVSLGISAQSLVLTTRMCLSNHESHSPERGAEDQGRSVRIVSILSWTAWTRGQTPWPLPGAAVGIRRSRICVRVATSAGPWFRR